LAQGLKPSQINLLQESSLPQGTVHSESEDTVSQMQSMKLISPLADVKQPSVNTSVDLVQFVSAIIVSNQMEFLMFFSAVLAYFILFRSRATYAKAHVNVAQLSAQTSLRPLQTTPTDVQKKKPQ